MSDEAGIEILNRVEGSFWSKNLFTYASGEDISGCYRNMGNSHVFFEPYVFLSGRIKYRFIVVWHSIQSSKNVTGRQQLASFISDLPSATLLDSVATPDQVLHWAEMKDCCIDIAKCLLAGHTQPDNPLLRGLEEDLINQWSHDSRIYSAMLYDNLFKIVTHRWKTIKRSLDLSEWGCPFSTGTELVQEIIASEINEQFSNCLKPYYASTPYKMGQIYTLGRKVRRNREDSESLEKLRKKVKPHSTQVVWLGRLVSVCQVLAERDNLIQTHLEIHESIVDGICKQWQKATYKPKLSRHYSPSEEWRDGFKDDKTRRLDA